MSTPEQALATQVRNIEARTGQTLAAFREAIATSGKARHGEIRSWLMQTYSLGYGDANTLAHLAGKELTADVPSSPDDALAEIYSGKKAHLRAVHDAVIAVILPFGAFEMAPKKGYVAFRRKKQFAMLGPKTVERCELGLNLKSDIASDRILAQKPGGMCPFAVSLTRPEEVDGEIAAALKLAFDAAG